MYHLAVFHAGEAVDRTLTRRAFKFIRLWHVDEVTFIKQASRLVVRCLRFGY
jgi:hypothetical protein